MKKDLYLDYDPIKDGSWNLAPFQSDYVTPRRKSSVIDPFELMPAYAAFDAAPDAPPPAPKTRALTGLDDFGTEKLDMYDLVDKSSDNGLPMPIVEEFQIADEPNRKRIYDNVRKAQDWYLSAADEQIADQTYAVNFANAARSARDSDDYHVGFGSVQSTALKHDVTPMELHGYINGAQEQQQAIIEAMNNRIMPWAPGSGPADIGLYRNFSELQDQASMQESDDSDGSDWGVPETIYNRDDHGAGPGNAIGADDGAEPEGLFGRYVTNQHQTNMNDATQEPLQLAQVNQPPTLRSTGTGQKGNTTVPKSSAINPASTYHVPKSVNESQIKVYTDAMLAEMDGDMDAFEWLNTADGKGLKLVTASGKTVERLDKERGKTKIVPYIRTFEQAQNLGWEKLNPYVAPTQEEMDYVYSVIETHFPSKGFMKRIAVQESDEGQHRDTGRSLYYGGAFQVDEPTFRETQIQDGIKDQRDRVSEIIQRDWNTVTWRELRDNPLLSGLAARLSLMRFRKAIPKDLKGQAELWKKKYNTSDGAGTEAEFIKKSQGPYNPSHLGM